MLEGFIYNLLRLVLKAVQGFTQDRIFGATMCLVGYAGLYGSELSPTFQYIESHWLVDPHLIANLMMVMGFHLLLKGRADFTEFALSTLPFLVYISGTFALTLQGSSHPVIIIRDICIFLIVTREYIVRFATVVIRDITDAK